MMIHTTEEQWNGRHAVRITNGGIEAVVLPGGGHIAELRFVPCAGPSVNCLWAAPWKTADPDNADFLKLTEAYGGGAMGRYMAAYTGHSLCLDNFGAPSAEDAARGVSLHGEAPVRQWEIEPTQHALTAHVHLPVAGIDFERTLRMNTEDSALLVEETVRNQRAEEREIHWVEHVSFGPPFLDPGCSSIYASLDHGLTWPLGYEGHELLRGNAAFEWPVAPSCDGSVSLETPFQRSSTGFIAAVRVRPDCEIAFIAALNRTLGLALVYCFRREDFPWVAVWEENRARRSAPWYGKAQVRGMEFGTTPMPVGREAIRRMGPLFGTPGSRTLPAEGARSVRYAACLARIPKTWNSVSAVEADDVGLRLIGPHDLDGEFISIASHDAAEFLRSKL